MAAGAPSLEHLPQKLEEHESRIAWFDGGVSLLGSTRVMEIGLFRRRHHDHYSCEIPYEALLIKCQLISDKSFFFFFLS